MKKSFCRPDAIVLPGSTQEVSDFIKVCNKYKIKYKAHSTGYGAHNGATSPDMVLVDLRRMNRVIELDEKNMIAIIEPYAVGSAIQAEAWKKGLNVAITTAGPQSSVLSRPLPALCRAPHPIRTSFATSCSAPRRCRRPYRDLSEAVLFSR